MWLGFGESSLRSGGLQPGILRPWMFANGTIASGSPIKIQCIDWTESSARGAARDGLGDRKMPGLSPRLRKTDVLVFEWKTVDPALWRGDPRSDFAGFEN